MEGFADLDTHSSWFVLPPELVPSENLTQRVQRAAAPARSPFNGDRNYDRLFDQLARGLYRSRPRHLLLVGEPGVGQNTVLVELARRAASGDIPFLRDKQIISIDCSYVASDESRSRLDAVMNHVGGREDLIVCIDGLAALLRGECGMDNRSRLLWALSCVRCRVVGLVTPYQYEERFANEPDAMDFFNTVGISEPDIDVALRLLSHFAVGLEHEYDVRIDDDAVRQAVVWSHHYILNQRLPLKALKILHAECDDIRYERTQQNGRRNRVTTTDVLRRVAAVSGVPESTLAGVGDAIDYQESLRRYIVGQDHVVSEVATELGLIKAGLTDPGKPASVMLFVGQTGTGKTEMAKVLARFYSVSKKLKTFTLGNFVEPHSVSGIIGVPSGYVGHDQGGRLINELNADPYGVFLLDEADKAHPDVMGPFLNLFDEGWIYDQRGVKAFADKAIFILTTNVGQRQIAEMCHQGKTQEEITTKVRASLSQIRHTKSNRPVFTPEFLARIKRFIVFRSLDGDAMLGIAQRLAADMRRQWLQKRGKNLKIDQSVLQAIANKAHQQNSRVQGNEGGRIVRKLVSDHIESQIQRVISVSSDKYRRSTTVNVEHDHGNGDLSIQVRLQ